MKLFNELLQDLKTTVYDKYQTLGIQKPTFPVHVSILGTEERNLGLFSQFTIYIAQISIEQINTKVFLRYSEVQKLESEIRRLFPQVRIPRLVSNQWNNKNTIVIEDRKFQIEKLLQIILNAPDIRESP